jgi:hypothetical protein
VLHQRGLGDLEFQQRRVDPGLVDDARIEADQAAVHELARRQVDRQRHRRQARRAARPCLFAGARITHSPTGTIRPFSSRIGMNSSGSTRPCSGSAPAQQHFQRRTRARRAVATIGW